MGNPEESWRNNNSPRTPSEKQENTDQFGNVDSFDPGTVALLRELTRDRGDNQNQKQRAYDQDPKDEQRDNV
jgi:hypothetical protein